ncbi:MAG TPA: hypothetical protein VJA85_09560 [Candidatus Limnocylindria bacterium]|nr:hypothetical protein [Candidatus Limnocylindria bacterium]
MSLPPEAHRLRADHLPTPFSATQIRDGCPAGRVIRLREESPGELATYRRIRFVEVDRDGAVQEYQATDADGAPIGAATRRRSSWLALQGHASQPADATSVEEVDLELTFGRFACWRYVVRRPEGEMRFWFAQVLPGMPVRVEAWVDGALGERTVMIDSRMEG